MVEKRVVCGSLGLALAMLVGACVEDDLATFRKIAKRAGETPAGQSTDSPSPVASISASPSPTPSIVPTAFPTPVPTPTPTVTPTPSPSPIPSLADRFALLLGTRDLTAMIQTLADKGYLDAEHANASSPYIRRCFDQAGTDRTRQAMCNNELGLMNLNSQPGVIAAAAGSVKTQLAVEATAAGYGDAQFLAYKDLQVDAAAKGVKL